MKGTTEADIIRTPNPNCKACVERRWHTEEEWKNHPKRGTGVEYRKAPQT